MVYKGSLKITPRRHDMYDFKDIEAVDPEIAAAIDKELGRQRSHLD